MEQEKGCPRNFGSARWSRHPTHACAGGRTSSNDCNTDLNTSQRKMCVGGVLCCSLAKSARSPTVSSAERAHGNHEYRKDVDDDDLTLQWLFLSHSCPGIIASFSTVLFLPLVGPFRQPAPSKKGESGAEDASELKETKELTQGCCASFLTWSLVRALKALTLSWVLGRSNSRARCAAQVVKNWLV